MVHCVGHFGDGGVTAASARIIAAEQPHNTVCAVLRSV